MFSNTESNMFNKFTRIQSVEITSPRKEMFQHLGKFPICPVEIDKDPIINDP